MMKFLKQMVGMVILVGWSVTAAAIPMTSNVGLVTILGDQFDVDIVYDSNGVYDQQSFNILNPSIYFTTEADATAAVVALNLAFPAFDWNPGGSENGTRVSYFVDLLDYSYMTVANGGAPNGPFTRPRDEGNNFSFALFTKTDISVPAPATLVLVGLGLAGLGFSRSKQKQRN